ncbi:MAG: hypothetical protein ACKV1O_29935 [Saprospiraceae bacterium]
MKAVLGIILACMLFVSKSKAQNPDSLTEIQIQKTTKYYREVRGLTKEIGKTNNNFKAYLNSIEEIQKRIDSLNSITFSNSQTISELNSKSQIAEEKKFDWREFWSNLFVEVMGAFVGAGAAILIFYNQIKHDRKKEAGKKIEEQKENNFYLNSLIQSTLNRVTKQREAIKKFYEEIESNPIEIPIISLIPMQDLKRLAKVVDNEIYYYSFLEEFGKTKEIADKYRKITVSVDYLNAAVVQMEDILWKDRQFDRDRKLKYKELFENGMDATVEIAKQFEQTNPRFSDVIFKYIVLYHESCAAAEPQQLSLDSIQNIYIKPFKSKLVLDRFTDLPEARQIITNLKQVEFAFSDIVMNNKKNAEPFKEFYKNFGSAIEKLEENSKEIKEKNSLLH